MTIPLLAELPYRPDSAPLFEAIADLPWAVFLDSGQHHPGQSRYDILAAQPCVRLVTRGALTEIHADGVTLSREDPFVLVRRALEIDPACGGDLPFAGGAIGYFGYDLARRLEKLPALAEDAERIPDMAIGIYDWACVVDHLERRSWLVGQGRDPETDLRWSGLIERLSAPPAERPRAPLRITTPVASNMTREQYGYAFTRIMDYIREGDCYQVNLAQRFAAGATGDAWSAYQRLRVINPAPFSAYLSTPYAKILSSSPELFLKVEGGRVETRPIKGTRPRAGHARVDAEIAEAAREREGPRRERDDRRPAAQRPVEELRPGTVRVPRLFDVESFATVHHLVSTVTGELALRARRARSAARMLSRRLDHRCAQVARDADHRGARAAPPRRLLRRHRLHRLRWRHGQRTSRSARWSARSARSASGRAVASSPTRSWKTSTGKPSTRPRRC
jgi:para-aminobenzoate synthetase component I